MKDKKIKGITIEIGGDTTKLGKALESINSTSSKTQKELNKINKLLKFDSSNTTLLKQKYDVLNESLHNAEKKLDSLKEAQKEVQDLFEKGDIGIEEYRDFQREVVSTEQKVEKLKKQVQDFGNVGTQVLKSLASNMHETGEKIEGIGKKVSKFSVPTIAGLVGCTKSAIDFESAFTGVEKTVDGTAEQMAELKQGIRDMAKEIPSSTTEIAEVAEAAGQLGIKTEDVLSFTRVMIDLGNATNLTADEASSALAKFANIMGTTSDNYERLGSTIVDLGNNYATTEADIVAMTMRLAGAGKQVGLSEGQVLGLATALSSVGIEAEMGGSAISKAMVKMQNAVEQGGTKLNSVLSKTGLSLRQLELMSANDSKSFKEWAQMIGMTSTELKQLVTAGSNLEDFAKVSGMTVKQFKKAWKEDAAGALSAFIKGLGDAESKGQSAITMLSEMGLTEVRLRDSLLRAANAGNLFNDAINMGTKAWQENTALTNEVSKRYNTVESKMKLSINRIKDLSITIGSKMLPTVEKALKFVDKTVDKFDKLDNKTQDLILTAGGITAAAGPALITGGKIVKGASSLIDGVSKITSKLSASKVVIGGVIAAVGLLATVYINSKKSTDEYVISTKKLNDEQKKLTDTINSNKIARDENIKSAEVEAGTADALYKKLVDLESVENKTNAQKELMVQVVSELNELMPSLNIQYDKENDKLNKNTDAIKEQINAQKELMKAKAAQEQLSGIMSDIVSQEMALTKVKEQHSENFKHLLDSEKKLKEFTDKNGNNMLYYTNKQCKEYIKLRDSVTDANKAYMDSARLLGEQEEALNDLNEEYSKTEKYIEKAFNTAEIETKLSTLNALVKEKGLEIPESLAKGMEENKYVVPTTIDGLNSLIKFETALNETNLAGAEIPLEFSQKIIDGTMTVEDAVASINNLVQFEEAVAKSDNAGKDIPESMKNGILNGTLSVNDAMKQLDNTVIAEAKTLPEILSGVGVNAGGNLVEGTKVGINNKKGSLISTVTNLGLSVLSAFKSSLDEHSPSKASEEDAEFFLKGFEIGISKNKKSVLNKVSSFGEETLSSLKKGLNDNVELSTEFNGTREIMMRTLTGQNLDYNANNNANSLQSVLDILKEYMPQLLNKTSGDLYLDGKKVSKVLAPNMNNELGIITVKERRGY